MEISISGDCSAMSIFTDDSKLIKAIEFQIKGLVDEEIDKIKNKKDETKKRDQFVKDL